MPEDKENEENLLLKNNKSNRKKIHYKDDNELSEFLHFELLCHVINHVLTEQATGPDMGGY